MGKDKEVADVVVTCEGMAVTWEEGRGLAGRAILEGTREESGKEESKGF